MSNPLFQVGQLVGVCVRDLSIVIPSTTVLHRKWRDAGPMRTPSRRVREFPAGWYYCVSHYARSPLDRRKRFWIPEWFLRAIIPGEYQDTTQDLVLPVDGVVA